MRGKRLHALAVSLLIIAGGLAYANSLTADFQFDDYHMLVQNNYIKQPGQLSKVFLDAEMTSKPIMKGMYRPVLMTSFAANYAIGGLRPMGYHLVNVLIHVSNAVLLYILMLGALPGIVPTAAILAALLFVVHPLNTQSVTYLSSRSSLLATFGCLGAVLAYIRWRRDGGAVRSSGWLLLAWLCYAAGLGSKEIAISLPAVIVMWEVLIGRRIAPISWRRIGVAWGGFVVLSMAYLWGRKLLIGHVGVIVPVRDMWTNILTQTTIGPFFLRLWCWPSPLTIDRLYPEVTSALDLRWLLSVAVLAGLAVLAVRYRSRRPALLFGVGWFALTFFPVAFASSLNQMTAEHHAYLPSIGWYVMLGVGLSILILRPVPDIAGKRRRRLQVILAGLPCVLLLTGMTIHRNVDWQNGLTIWEAAVRDAPASARAYVNLGLQYHMRDEYALAESNFLRGLGLAMGTPQEAGARANLGALYRETGRYQEAERELNRAMQLSANDRPDFLVQLGLTYKELEQYDKALRAYSEAITLNPWHALAYLHRGALHWHQGDFARAEQDFRQTILANPDYTLAHLMLGQLFESREQWQDAADAYRSAVRLDPSNPQIYCRLGTALARIGDGGAIPALEQAVRMDPTSAEANYNLAVALSVLEPMPIGRVKEYVGQAVRLGWPVNQDFVEYIAGLHAGGQ